MVLISSKRSVVLRWIVFVFFASAMVIASWLPVVTGAGCGGSTSLPEEVREQLSELENGLAVASSSGAGGEVEDLKPGDEVSYRPPSLPPAVDHPSFLVTASPAVELVGADDAAKKVLAVTVGGRLIDQQTGRPVVGEVVTGVQVRRMSQESAAKSLRMKFAEADENGFVEIDVQQDLTD